MPLPEYPIWKFTVFNANGDPVATVSQCANHPVCVEGDMAALQETLPAISSLPRFFTDPENAARSLYEEFRRDCAETYGLSAAEWNTLAESDPALADKWRELARMAASPSILLN